MTLYHELLHTLYTFIFFLIIEINLESENFIIGEVRINQVVVTKDP